MKKAIVLAVLGAVFLSIIGVAVNPPEDYVSLVLDRELVPVLKYYFPNAYLGVADTVYQTISEKEMVRFLKEDPTDNKMPEFYGDYLDSDDYAWRLLGNMSADPAWSRVPFGYIVRAECGFVSNEDAVFFNIFVTKEDGDLVIYEINPMTDEIWRVRSPQPDALIVMI